MVLASPSETTKEHADKYYNQRWYQRTWKTKNLLTRCNSCDERNNSAFVNQSHWHVTRSNKFFIIIFARPSDSFKVWNQQARWPDVTGKECASFQCYIIYCHNSWKRKASLNGILLSNTRLYSSDRYQFLLLSSEYLGWRRRHIIIFFAVSSKHQQSAVCQQHERNHPRRNILFSIVHWGHDVEVGMQRPMSLYTSSSILCKLVIIAFSNLMFQKFHSSLLNFPNTRFLLSPTFFFIRRNGNKYN